MVAGEVANRKINVALPTSAMRAILNEKLRCFMPISIPYGEQLAP